MLLCSALSAAAVAQSENDVGLTMDGGILTVIYGQNCGPLACTPFPAGGVTFLDRRTVIAYGAMQSPYMVALGLRGPCLQFPGVGNRLLLQLPAAPLFLGVCDRPLMTGACRQYMGRNSFVLPPSGPAGLAFRMQSVGVGNAGIPAFGPALDLVLR
ncbi:MAG: hypothetical protein Fur0037_24370 [Planctomycetota bacterium]